MGLGLKTKLTQFYQNAFNPTGPLQRSLRRDPEFLPASTSWVISELLKRRRNKRFTDYGSRSLPHRWRHIDSEIHQDLKSINFSLSEKRTLNLGAGVNNPLALGLLWLLRGAQLTASLDVVRPDLVETCLGLQEQIIDVISSQFRPDHHYENLPISLQLESLQRKVRLDRIFNFSESFTDGGMTLLSDNGQKLAEAFGLNSFDFIYSRSVFEHISQPEEVAHSLYQCLSSGGVMYHDIDLSAHNHEDKFAFYFKDEPKYEHPTEGLNRMRLSDFEALFQSVGFKTTVLRAERSPYAKEKKLLARFKKYSEQDLETVKAVLLCKKD